MEVGEGSNSGRRQNTRPRRAPEVIITYETSVDNLSREGRATLGIVNRSRRNPLNTINGTASTVFDNASPNYNWLRSGWIAEERRMLSTNRLYRYYFDPMGQMYNTRQEVEIIFEEIEKHMEQRNRVIIVLDK